MTKEQIQAIVAMKEAGQKTCGIAKTTGSSDRRIRNVLHVKFMEERGMIEPESPKKRGRKPVDPDAAKQELLNIIRDDCCLTHLGISEELRRRGLDVSEDGVFRFMKKNRITRKVVSYEVEAASDSDLIRKRSAYAEQVAALVDTQIVFIDEVGVNLHTCEKYGYAPIGITPVKYRRPQRGIHFSIICAISHDRIVAFEILEESATGATFALRCSWRR